MIATITLNPSLDRTITVDGLKIDETNRWKSVHLYAGGKGIDVSRAIHEMGGDTIAYGFIGGTTGRTIEILLDEEGVLFSFTPIGHDIRTNFIITDTKTYQQTRIGDPGPPISARELARFRRKLKGLRIKPDMLVAGGSVPPRIPENVYYEIIAEAKPFGVRTLLDSEGKWLEEGIKAKPYLIKPNVYEASELLKKELPSEETIIKAALDLVEMGIEICVISRGKEGLIAASKKSVVKSVPPVVKVRSAVGAGDCTMAGLALKLVSNRPLTEACQLAAAMGTATVLTPGTELCHREDVEEILPQVKIMEKKVSELIKTYSFAD